MFIRAMKRSLPTFANARQNTAAATQTVRSAVFYGPKSLDTLKKETTVLHDKAEAAYMKALMTGQQAAAFGHLSESLRQYNTLTALNTSAFHRVPFMKTAPLEAPACIPEPRAVALPKAASSRVLEADAASGVRGIGGRGVAIKPIGAGGAGTRLRRAIDGADTGFGVGEALNLST